MLFAEHTEADAVFREQLNRIVAPGDGDEFAVGKVRRDKRIEAEGPLFPDALSAKRVERYRLAPVGDAEHVNVVRAVRAE